ncbi:hypothetical protein MMC22_006025 [Lobaria immixta]|nr:hypothetical protein [Lobaria immixta]
MFFTRDLKSPVFQKWRLTNWADCGKPIVKIMGRNGWFPNELAHFDSKEMRSIGRLWYYANLGPPKAHVKHHKCTSEQCRLLQVDLRDYRSVHSVEGCDSAFQGPLAEVLAETVMTGKALITLNEPFEYATHVLVLDIYLRRLYAETMGSVEIVSRISTCSWTQRLWTFVEGRFGKSILFQFRDRATDLYEAIDTWKETFLRIPSVPSNGVDLEMIVGYTATRIFPGQVFDRSILEVPTLRFALSTRATSWKSDEALCLGGVLKLDMEKIEKAEDAKKMQIVWSLMSRIPSGLAFPHASHKLTDGGYRWAPASLMGDLNIQRWGALNPYLQSLTPVPLKNVLSQLYQFNTAKSRLLESCIHRDRDNFDLTLKGRNGSWYVCEIQQNWHQDPNYVDLSTEEPAIILESSPIFATSIARNDFESMESFYGLLVTFPQSEIGEKSLHAKAHRHVHVQVLSKKGQQLLNGIEEWCTGLVEQHGDEIRAA